MTKFAVLIRQTLVRSMLCLPKEKNGLHIHSALCEANNKNFRIFKFMINVWPQRIVPRSDSRVEQKVSADSVTSESFSLTLQNPLTKAAHTTKFLFQGVPSLPRTRFN